jgi:transglutaminase-like putative cysteine protease
VSFALLHKLVTYLISGLGLYALSLGGELGPGPSVAFFVAWAASFFVEGERLRDERWIQGWNVAVVAFFVIEIARGVLGEPFLALGLEYAGFLQISRLFNRRGARDHQQIAVLAFLHLIAATVLSTDLAYGFVFVGFVVTTPWMLVLTQLRQEIEGNYEKPGTRRGPDVDRVLASRRIVGPGFLAGTAALTLPIFVVTVALFLMFPRVGLGFLSFGSRGGQRTAGFGQNVELGDFGVIRDNPEVVMRLKLPMEEGAARPARIPILMRGTSFDRYDGRRWTRGDSSRRRQIRAEGDYYRVRRERRLEDAEVEVILDHLDEPVIFLPARTVGLEIPPRIEGAVDRARRVDRAVGLDIRYADDDGLGLRYSAFVSTDPREELTETLEPEDRQRYLELPDGVERVAALARQLTESSGGDLERANAIQAHLRDSGDFTYSLEMPAVPTDADPLEVFLFEAKYGHCEYYSTAMAVMLRTIGIPSRNVTGFAGAFYNPYGDYYAVRQGDAHSWVEAYVDDRWVTFDPTPPARGELGADDGLLADVRAIMDAIRTRWDRDVVGYDLRAQVRGLRRFFRWSWRIRNQLAGGGEEPETASTSSGGLTDRAAPFLGAAVALLIVFVGVWLALRRRRRRRQDKSGLTSDARSAVRLYRQLERALDKNGLPRPTERTPREHAEAVREEGFAEADLVEEVTRRYEESRWGGDTLPRDELTRLRRKIAAIMRPPPP